MIGVGARARVLFALVVASSLVASEARAQSFRGWVGSTVRYMELQPLGLDTVPLNQVEVGPDGETRTFTGEPVSCVRGLDACTLYRSQGSVGTVWATQDLRLTAWGFGVQGLSATLYARNRLRSGGELLWPRSDDELDVLLAYAQLDRGRWRFRLGRQETQSGLGFNGFDGLRVTSRVGGDTRVEAFAGRSLARGLRESHSDALNGIEDFFPDKDAYLLGVSARGELPEATYWGARYQREIFTDRRGIISERGSIDVSTGLFKPLRLNASVDYDFAFGHLGKSHATLQYVIPSGRWMVEATGRRYTPYFEMSTIWGFFEPVSYHEGELRFSWSPISRLGVRAWGGIRSYQDANFSPLFGPLENESWRAGWGAVLTVNDAWSLDANYRIEWGAGAFLESADARARWSDGDVHFNAALTTFQQIEEFRLGNGRVFGGHAGAGFRVLDRTWLDGAASLYLHRPIGDGARVSWDQFRVWMSVRVELGSDPGLRR